MADYFVGQTNLRIELETDVTLTGATLLIKYINPVGDEGSFSATINGSDASKMYYDISTTSDINLGGDWKFWSHVTFADSTIGIGSTIKQYFHEEGEI